MATLTPVFHAAERPDFTGHILDDEPTTTTINDAATIVHQTPITVEQAEQAIERMKAKRPSYWKDSPTCGTVTIQNVSWEPANSRDVPPSVTDELGMELAGQYVLLYNQSDISRRKRRWAVLTNRGSVVILSGISPQDRPADPADFPPCVQAGLTFRVAEDAANRANKTRYDLARIPRQWTISLRRADSVTDPKLADEGTVTP
ncbi:hypothetical protein [Schlesneria sp. DSM 10557]|uniref:hypothetical protein n=1 Tax=Schlesneria sp. DSM 10557 TaxID=3044399 RepID=UPI0035A12C3A